MARKKIWTLPIAAILAVAWMLSGCGGSGGGTSRIQISLVDAPLDADAVYVDITSVEVHESGAGWTTLASFSPAQHVNLLDYRTGGQSLMLADCPLAAGHYTMVRLMLSAAEVVVGGQSYQVDLRNVTQTGVKCNGQFTVQEGEIMALMLDFNAGRAFVDTGNGDYMLHPVMSMSPVNVAAQVTGTVVFQDGTGAPLPVPANVIVNLYTPGHVGEADYLAASTAAGVDGAFIFDVVAQGQYDLEVQYPVGDGSTTQSHVVPNVQVVAPLTALPDVVVVVQ